MTSKLDNEYFTWLYNQVCSVKSRTPTRTHWSLLRRLYDTEFTWFVPNDDNRVEDGRELLQRFLDDKGYDDVTPGDGCSFLEMMLGLSERLCLETDRSTKWWFWHLIKNLGLHVYNDQNFVGEAPYFVDGILERVVQREYDADGHGGLFPLDHPKEDQRCVELWYQCNAYLIERF